MNQVRVVSRTSNNLQPDVGLSKAASQYHEANRLRRLIWEQSQILRANEIVASNYGWTPFQRQRLPNCRIFNRQDVCFAAIE